MSRKRQPVSESSEFDASREQEVRDALKAAQADLQAARERSQSPSFVPAESEESKAFEVAKREVAKFEADKAKAEAAVKAEAGEPAAPSFTPEPVKAEDEDAGSKQ
jgi:hypothetical protein